MANDRDIREKTRRSKNGKRTRSNTNVNSNRTTITATTATLNRGASTVKSKRQHHKEKRSTRQLQDVVDPSNNNKGGLASSNFPMEKFGRRDHPQASFQSRSESGKVAFEETNKTGKANKEGYPKKKITSSRRAASYALLTTTNSNNQSSFPSQEAIGDMMSLQNHPEIHRPCAPGAYSQGAPGAEIHRTDPIHFSILNAPVLLEDSSALRRATSLDFSDGGGRDRYPNNSNMAQDRFDDEGQITRDSTRGMAVANLVLEEDCPDVEDLPQAEGVDLRRREHQKNKTGQWNTVLVALAAVGMFLTGIILVFVPDWGSQDKSPSVTFTDFPSPLPSQSPTVSLGGYVLSHLPPHTLVALEDPESPQALAYDWMVEDPSLMTYSSERIIQRFALAVFFFASGGLGWRNNNDWLSYEVHECSWFASDTLKMLVAGKILHDVPAVYTDIVFPLVNESSPCQDPENTDAYTHLLLVLNNLKGSIPEELYMLTTLKTIFLGPNPEFTGPGLSTEIARLSSLEKLGMPATKFTGTIPTEVGLLPNLKLMGCGANLLEGTIPTEFGLLSDSLKVMDLFGNQLVGTMPTQLGSLTELKVLNLHHNEGFPGTIPSQIGNLKSVRFMSLSKSSLTGSIPSELGMLESVEQIYLYSNNLNGTVPNELTNLVTDGNLEVLFLFDNVLSGSIPEELCSIDTVSETVEPDLNSNQALVGCNCNCTSIYEQMKGIKVCSPLPNRCAR